MGFILFLSDGELMDLDFVLGMCRLVYVFVEKFRCFVIEVSLLCMFFFPINLNKNSFCFCLGLFIWHLICQN